LECPLTDTSHYHVGSRRGLPLTISPDLRVLIVEDQALLAMELELVLGEFGCDVIGSAMDRDGALAIADRERPDLALVDLNLLDGPTGPEIAQRLVELYGTTVVFLTANIEQIPEGFSGAIGAVSKPFDESTVRGVVAFARQFIRSRTLGEAPRRVSMAPWLTPPPVDAAPH